jgi:hypothetical protein
MKKLLLLAVMFTAFPALAQTVPTVCNPNSPGDCVRAAPIVGPDGLPIGTSGTIATGQVTIGTTATLLVAARPGRKRITYSVTSATQCSYGNSGVTLATGFPLQGVAGATQTLDTAAAIYGVCAASATVGYVEQF